MSETNEQTVSLPDSENGTSESEHRQWRRSQILDVAEKLFAEHGLDGTSIREVSAALQCNNAMIYYYYDSKEALYGAVVRRYLRRRSQRRIEAVRSFFDDAGGDRSLEHLLRRYVEGVLDPDTDESGVLLVQLLSRELLEPHVAPAAVYEELVEPVQAALTDALQRVCPGLQEVDAHRAIHSVVAQVVHAIYFHRLLERANSPEAAAFDWDEAIDHVVRFSAAGIRALMGGNHPARDASSRPEDK